MPLSRLAREFAAEIRLQDWSDAPYRLDRAGHNREHDTNRLPDVLTPEQTERIRTNVMWVTAQVLGYGDPNFHVYEFADACGVNTKTRRGEPDGGIEYGLRREHQPGGRYQRPGTYEYDDDKPHD